MHHVMHAVMQSFMNNAPITLVVLVSGSGSNLQAILDNIADGTLRAGVSAVISDRADAFGLTRAARAGIPAVVVAHRDYPSPAAFYDALLRRVESFAPDLVVLAGFMRILPARFVGRFEHRIMNIHPSLLPRFKGLDTHQRALDAGERRHGATAHLVTKKLDDGPIILQAKVEIADDDNAETLATRVLQQEHRIYSHAIQSFAENRQSVVAQPASEKASSS